MALEQTDKAAIAEHLKIISLTVGKFLVKSQEDLKNIKVISKSANQLVSEIDITAEKMIVSYLQEHFPEAGFLTEENTTPQESKPLIFIIDPLDGTTNFLHGLDIYSISVAAVLNNNLIAGVVHVPSRNELFSAAKGEGAFLNNESISVSNSATLSDSLLATGFPYYNFKGKEKYIASLDFLMQNTRGLRRMGSAAIDLAYTACGRFCGYFEMHLHPWDVAAGILLVQEAGGKASDFKGIEGDWSGKEIVASNSGIYDEFKTSLCTNFNLQ